ncbi:protein kinase domain-containing protein [Mycobacterium sp.]|uniref:serine/threonine-protein kinase n=1 Tax=Mycobacterium sp. TaxID=1785 RepID=UPI003BA8FD01
MSEAPDSRVGSMFGPYRLTRLLGRGGMGDVYEAEHTVKEWTVAVKVMAQEFSKDAVFRERMKREARIAGRLQEPHVVPIHDYGEVDGQLFLEMRLVEGTDLDSVLKRFGPLTPPRAVAIISQIASALDAAHADGVMHRDVKPPNILITRDDFAYLVDFGIASATTDEKLTQLGTAVGTWKYMAPERFSNTDVTYRADIYALTCVLYECLTGSPPYRADSAPTAVTAHLMEPIPQPSTARSSIPKAFDAVIARGMAKQPEDRYASAGDLALAAHDALSHPDQDHAVDILRRSQESTLPGPGVDQPPPTARVTTPPPAAPIAPSLTPPTPAYADPYSSEPQQQPTPAGQPGWVPANPPAPAPQYFQSTSWNATPPPPPQPGGPPSWNQPSPPRKSNPWPIVAGAVALVLFLVLGALGIWAVTRRDNTQQQAGTASSTTTRPGKQTTTRTDPATPTTAAGDAAQGKLLNMLPSGYPSGVCRPTTPKPNSIWVGALAMVDCAQNTNPGGPAHAVYGLFPSTSALKQAFDDDIATVTLTNCPGEGPSPDQWHYDRTPTVTAGMIACGTYKDRPNVIWTNESDLMLNWLVPDIGSTWN